MVMPEQIDERDVRLSPRSGGGSRILQQDLARADGLEYQTAATGGSLMESNAISAVLKPRCLGFVRIPEPNLTSYSSDHGCMKNTVIKRV